MVDKTVRLTQMGLIYVNPEGPNATPTRSPRPSISGSLLAAWHERRRDVALIAGRSHAGQDARGPQSKGLCRPRARGRPHHRARSGWKSRCGKGMGVDTVTSGLEGAWTSTPIQWSHEYLDNLFNFEWSDQESGGSPSVVPKGMNPLVPDAHDPSKKHLQVMLTTDLSLIKDPEYRKISSASSTIRRSSIWRSPKHGTS